MKNHEPFLKVETLELGQKYHLSWARKGCAWVLVDIDEDGQHCTLVTPKTNKKLRAKVSDLRHTRNQQERIEEGRGPYGPMTNNARKRLKQYQKQNKND